MTVTVKVDPIDRDIKVMLAEDLSPAAASAMLAQFARSALTDAEEQNRQALGTEPPHETFVDGSANASEDAVRPDGVIVYQFMLVSEAIAWIDAQLIEKSPVKSGQYQRSHMLFADGTETDPNGTLPEAQEFVFLNIQPYARKIERGESQAAPEGVYEGVAALASARFGNIARVSFTYRSPASGAVVDWSQTLSAHMHAWRRHRRTPEGAAAWLTRQPAILIRPY